MKNFNFIILLLASLNMSCINSYYKEYKANINHNATCAGLSKNTINKSKATPRKSQRNEIIGPNSYDCISIIKDCRRSCRNNYKRCSYLASKDAQKKYFFYKHEQFIKGEIVLLQLNSFKDPLQCQKITCDCEADYKTCKSQNTSFLIF